MSSGALGTVNGTAYTPVAVAVGSFVPPGARSIRGRIHFTGNTTSSMAVTPIPGPYTGFPGANPPPFNNGAGGTGTWNVQFDFMLKSANIYWASAAADGTLRCAGWENNL